MPDIDYYETLGVDHSASADTIKLAYRRQARRLHPDVSDEVDAENRFKELVKAWENLRDPARRAAYDLHRSRARPGREFTAPPDFTTGFSFDTGKRHRSDAPREFTDLFDAAMFKRAGSESPFVAHDDGVDDARAAGTGCSTPHANGAPETDIVIALADAYTGARRTVQLRRLTTDVHGQPTLSSHRVTVDIPRGIAPGETLRIPGEGKNGADLHLTVRFRNDARWGINGHDVILNLPITPWEAALGAVINVAAPGRRIEVAVPAGSQGGRRLRLRGEGIPASPPGDLYLRLRIAMPEAVTDAARAAWRKLAETVDFDPREATRA